VDAAGRKSSIFEGLEDDLPAAGDLFVPRSSLKKLVLRPKASYIIFLFYFICILAAH
jgi:hypothetical protein